MFVTKIFVSTDQIMSSDELLDKADLLANVYGDEWFNAYTKSFELSYVERPWFLYKSPNQPEIIQTMISQSAEDRQKFLDIIQPATDKIKQKLEQHGIILQIEQEDNVTDIIGVKETP